MKKNVYKLFWAWQFEEEEQWLNQCSNRGMQLCDVGFLRYTFEMDNPVVYSFKVELFKEWPTHAESEAYIRFVEETGAEMVGSILRWVYFRKPRNLGAFDLFSDHESRIKHLNRILLLFFPLFFLELYLGLSNIFMHNGSNRFIGMLALSVGVLIGYGIFRILHKRNKLKKDHILFE